MRNYILNGLNQLAEKTGAPIDINDIMSLCKSYSQLGYSLQHQVETILSRGIDQAIESGIVSLSSLHLIKDFLQQIEGNFYFADAADQAMECIRAIESFEENQPPQYKIAN